MPEFIIIVAMAKNRVIGRGGSLPWHLPSDLKHFKQTTMNHPMLMGRKTFDSIGRALPGRDNLVLTRDSTWQSPGCIVFNTIEQARQYCSRYEKVFIIGGGDIFRVTLAFTDSILLTALMRDVDGDVFFPEIDPLKFKQVSISHYDLEEPYAIIRYERLNKEPLTS